MTMDTPSHDPARRSFITRLGALGTAVAGLVALPSSGGAQTPQMSNGPTHPADAWLDELTAMHKNIYDCTSVENADTGFGFARNFLTANTGPVYQLKDSDLNVIVCVRHKAAVYGFNDAMWSKYKLGEVQKVMEGSEPATKNPVASAANDLAKRGVIVAICGMSTGRIARTAAAQAGLNAADVEAELRANLVTPTARVVAAGVVVTNRAQEKGFAYTYVG
jgi:intracellular sulfur oxidation DsrE/DsrF family protein